MSYTHTTPSGWSASEHAKWIDAQLEAAERRRDEHARFAPFYPEAQHGEISPQQPTAFDEAAFAAELRQRHERKYG